ncbi:MAG: hydroxymethylglutaryl-CoA lyase, partial [Bacteroidia bacterium]|nr:hydroxymethylglutaryl-CoA lyase [Bacteroidia bacterium]
DFGSFVSPKAVPQMKDTAEVLSKLDLSSTNSKLLAIVANLRGANDACEFEEISYLGFPFSISETFQQRNTNSSIEKAFENVMEIQDLCISNKKELVIYISMAFGNPYGDDWNADIALEWANKMVESDIKTISLADTVGVAEPKDIKYMLSNLIPEFDGIEFGVHLHTTPNNWQEKVAAAYENGCLRFDSAMKGFGGCPMADDDLTGNLASENLKTYLSEQNDLPALKEDRFNLAMQKAMQLMG